MNYKTIHKILITFTIIILLSSSIPAINIQNFFEKNNEENIIKNIDLVTLTDTSAIITWTTDQKTDTYSDYGLYPFFLENYHEEHNQSYTCFHYLNLENLQPETRYYYRVGSDQYNSKLKSFKTLKKPDGNYLFSFVTITDRHDYIDDPSSINISKKAIKEINKLNISFVIDKGDMGCPLNNSKKIIENLNTPYYPMYGDNDFIDSTIDVKGFLETYNLNSTYYSFNYQNYHFILLDTVNRHGFETGSISNEQFNWLKQDLEENKNKKTMIFMHHPCSNKDIPLIMALNLLDGLRFRFLITQYDVVGVFSGHTHRNKITYSFITKNIPFIETASLHKYPAGYNIYKVYTEGYMQSFYKINSNLSENKRHGEKEDLLSPITGRFGFIWDKNFIINYKHK